jgi:LPS sulfotransferase NodH
MSDARNAYYEKMMSAEKDIKGSTAKTSLRYCIASTPRSGSTLLSRSLEATQLAGVPMEYYNNSFMGGWQRLNPGLALQLNSYLSELESRRTTTNGVFGVKAHWSQLQSIANQTRLPLTNILHSTVGKCTKFIQINRRDKLAQAISLHIANQIKVYHSDQLSLRSAENVATFDASAISVNVARLFIEEASWSKYIKERGVDTIEVIYEDLVADHAGTCRRVFDFLGLRDVDIPSPPTVKLATSETAEFRRLYLQHLGS